MKKLIFTTLITLVISITSVLANKISCTQFDKISAKYLECSAKNLKGKSSKLKLKVTTGVADLKQKISTNTKNSKMKFDKSSLKEKFIKFKNSKTLTKFMEK